MYSAFIFGKKKDPAAQHWHYSLKKGIKFILIYTIHFVTNFVVKAVYSFIHDFQCCKHAIIFLLS